MKLYDSQFYEVTFNNSDFAYQQAKPLPKIVSFLTSTRWWRSTIKFYPSIHPSVQPGVEQGWQRDRGSRTWWSIKNSSRPAYHTEHWKSFSRKSQLPPISTDVGGPDSGLLRSIFNHVGLLLLKCNPAAVAVLPITCAVEKFKEGRSKFRVCVCVRRRREYFVNSPDDDPLLMGLDLAAGGGWPVRDGQDWWWDWRRVKLIWMRWTNGLTDRRWWQVFGISGRYIIKEQWLVDISFAPAGCYLLDRSKGVLWVRRLCDRIWSWLMVRLFL